MNEPPHYFPYVGAYGYSDHVMTSAGRGGAFCCLCPRAQKTLVTPLEQAAFPRITVDIRGDSREMGRQMYVAQVPKLEKIMIFKNRKTIY